MKGVEEEEEEMNGKGLIRRWRERDWVVGWYVVVGGAWGLGFGELSERVMNYYCL